ncbi:MAG: hypothetical protein ABI200_03305 [Gaiellales bacterium]
MNFHHAEIAELIPTNADASMELPTDQITGWHAYQGLPIGILRGLSPGTDVEVRVEQVSEEATDLAVADRVAFILTGRTGIQHVVLASSTGYLVAVVGPVLDWAAAMRMERIEHAPRIVSVATTEGVLPVLTAIAA